MKYLAICLAVVSLLSVRLLAGDPSNNPRELGPVVLKDLVIKDDKVAVRVDSGGCTDKASLKAKVQKEKGLSESTPHYVVSFERVRVDDCKAMMFDGVVLEYDVAKDLGISGVCTLSVTNRVVPRAQGAAVEGNAPSDALISATVRSIEMEIASYQDRLKTAEGGVGPAGNAEKFKKKIAELKGWLAQYKTMAPAQYPQGAPADDAAAVLENAQQYGPVAPAPKKVVSVWVKEAQKEGSTLFVDGMSKSGPFYHIAGIAGDGYGRLKLGNKYELTVYLVYKREYFGLVSDYYVYIAEIR